MLQKEIGSDVIYSQRSLPHIMISATLSSQDGDMVIETRLKQPPSRPDINRPSGHPHALAVGSGEGATNADFAVWTLFMILAHHMADIQRSKFIHLIMMSPRKRDFEIKNGVRKKVAY